MSHVTNVLISFSVMEDYSVSPEGDDIYAVMLHINMWLINKGYGAFGRDADHVSGGNKHLEPLLYVAAFNHFDLSAFLDFLRTLSWIEPEHVQVFVQEEDQDRFRVIEPCTPPAVAQARAEQAFREAYQQMDGAHRQRNRTWIHDMESEDMGLP